MNVIPSCTYAEFKAIVSALGPVRQVIYSVDGAGTSVVQALVIFVSRDFYVTSTLITPGPLVTTFITDFPAALQSTNGVQGQY